MKIIIDTNLWISFTIGKRLALLSSIVRSDVTVIICKEIVNEYLNVCHRPKFSRYITEKDIELTGDKDLLILEQHNHTRIIDINSYLSLTEN